jgi:hypothetical protein
MVNDDVWEQAWAGRRKAWYRLAPGQEILCIGCLEQRIGRTLMACDFIPDVPANDPSDGAHSDRLYDRLTATSGTTSERGLFSFLAERWMQRLPEGEREQARAAFERDVN